ncbi:MAG: hypothetical protein JWP35_3604 [Caulobacter sp.]|nr:hypothetical protein [Caulobacter sp.]
MRWTAIALAASAVLMSSPARADDDPGKVLRLVGYTTGPGPKTFVIDARIVAGDSAFDSQVTGWATSLDPEGGYGEVSGRCVETRCALSIRMGDAGMEAVADVGAGGSDGRYTYERQDDEKTSAGTLHLAPLTGPLPGGLGPLADPDAIHAPELADLLMWNGAEAGFRYKDPNELPDASLRDRLGGWQAGHQRPSTGLITDADLQLLRTGAEETRKTLGWTPLGDKAGTWRTGYPAALLPKATTVGREQHFAGADGKAELIVALDPPMSDEAFDALVDKETADSETRSSVNYNRSGGDMELRYEENSVVTVASWHNREGGMARQVLRYPADQNDTYVVVADILPAVFAASDDFKAP